MSDLPAIRVFEPSPGVLAFYGGRDGNRFATEDNWVDAGALALGIASYALLAGEEALVYDTGTTLEWGQEVRVELEARGARRLIVVLSHWHLDHVAGTAAFADCEVVANVRTAAHLTTHREAIESGDLEGPPAISPLVLPTRTFDGRETMRLGAADEALAVELLTYDIHSDDQTLVWLPDRGLLICGDAMEDTVTYVDEAERLEAHLRDLDRLRELAPRKILPCHGDPERIAAGGYPPELIDATEAYLRLLLGTTDPDPAADPDDAAERPLRELIAELPGADALRYFEPYERVHRQNLAAVSAL
jgi:glyoxylase-like metal-dependent hydrolase (beta-lactamase superfamily II)